jgi:succinate dehydrogenase / fumarate reductase, cytochrome b subunit
VALKAISYSGYAQAAKAGLKSSQFMTNCDTGGVCLCAVQETDIIQAILIGESIMAVEVQPSRKARPVNLALTTIHFPVTAVISILHRFSGTVLFLCIPFLLWMLNLSLSSPEGFAFVQAWLAKPLIKLMVWAVLSALIYHLVAGIRHFVMDFGFGESLKSGRAGAWITLLLSVIFAILLGIWLW